MEEQGKFLIMHISARHSWCKQDQFPDFQLLGERIELIRKMLMEECKYIGNAILPW